MKLSSHSLFITQSNRGPLKVLFLSADTGGGHRASAESLAAQVSCYSVPFCRCGCATTMALTAILLLSLVFESLSWKYI